MFTHIASLTCISRVNNHNRNAIEQSFIFQKGTKLSERPFAKFCSELFVSTFRSKPNVGQILNSNTFTTFFGRKNNRFCNSMINNLGVSSFFALKPFRQSSTIPPCGAFRSVCLCLNRTTNLLPMFTVFVKPISRILNTVRSYTNIRQTKIHTHESFYVINILFGYINGLKQIKLTFLKYQVRFSFYVRQVVGIMANKRNFQSATDSPKRNNIVGFVSHNPTVITYASKWSKFSFSFLVKLVRISNFCNTSYKNLRRKFKSSLVTMVNFVMEFKIIENLFLPSHIRNSIANSISFLHRIEKQVSLFISRQKFYFQCQLHGTNILNNFTYQKIIINNLKALQSHSSHPPFGMSVFPALIL